MSSQVLSANLLQQKKTLQFLQCEPDVFKIDILLQSADLYQIVEN